MDSQQVDHSGEDTVVDLAACDEASNAHELTVETLLEEVSIDGMCGVY